MAKNLKVEVAELISKKDLRKLKSKAEKFDKIEKIMVEAFEFDETGQPVKNGKDLLTIGEDVCRVMGYM